MSLSADLNNICSIESTANQIECLKGAGDNVQAHELYLSLFKNPAFSPDDNLLNNYAHNLLAIGEPDKARKIFKNLFGINIMAVSNYMVSCDYLGIPTSKRADIKKYYPLPSGERYEIKNINDKINLCYVTKDARFHVSGRLISRFLKCHDRDKFNVTLLYGGNSIDELTSDIIQNTNRVIFIGTFGNNNAMDSLSVYRLIRHLKTDILVDLDGHTNGGDRFIGVFAKRPAPLNMTMIGYPNTTSLPFMDVKIGSEICRDFSEKVWNNSAGYTPVFKTIYLKHNINIINNNNYYLNNKKPIILGVISNPSKISSDDIIWYDSILQKIPNSKLIYCRLKRQFTKEFSESIIKRHAPSNRSRIAIVNLMGRSYIEIFANINILLDTQNWNLHATMLDALSCGIPVLCAPSKTICSSNLSREVYRQIGIDHNSIYDALTYYTETGDRSKIISISNDIFNVMQTFDNTEQWTRSTEAAYIHHHQEIQKEIKKCH